MAKKRILRGAGDMPVVSKQEVLQDPKIKEAFKVYISQQGGGARMVGGNWWGDFVGWLKKNKVISTASKVGSIIAGATGFLPLATALGTVSSVSSAVGYGRGRKMKGGMFPQSIAFPSPSSQTPFVKF
jgi:hypothetical protein